MPPVYATLFPPLFPGPQFANKLDQLLEQVDATQTQLCATDHIEVSAVTGSAAGTRTFVRKADSAAWRGGQGGAASKLHSTALNLFDRPTL